MQIVVDPGEPGAQIAVERAVGTMRMEDERISLLNKKRKKEQTNDFYSTFNGSENDLAWKAQNKGILLR